MEIVKQKLQGIYGMKIIHLDPELRASKSQVSNLEAHVLIFEQKNSHQDVVTKFLNKNPESAVVDLGTPTNRDVEVTYQEFARLETCGLPQVLQALGF
jgi:hypothetical protein